MKFDKVNEPEHDKQSSTSSEMVSEAATTLTSLMSAKCCSHVNQSTY
jgi:hypothetical protein